MFNILVVVFLHPKVNIFSLTHKKKLKIFLETFPSQEGDSNKSLHLKIQNTRGKDYFL